MGLFGKIIDRYTQIEEEPIKPRKKASFFDQFFEEEIEFAGAEAMEEMAENLSEKIRNKRKDLKLIGMSVNSVNIDKMPESKEIVQEYIELLDEIEQISNKEKLSSGSILETAELERMYNEFERRYEEKIPKIKSLYLLSELIKQNNNMKKDYDKTPAAQLNKDKLQGYKEYIKKISIQQESITQEFKRPLMNQLIMAEYRLRMLVLMRNIYEGKEDIINPFDKDSDSKKQRYEEMFLEDLESLSNQYDKVTLSKRTYIKSCQYTEEDFIKLDEETDKLLNKLNDGFIDDFSILEIFDNKEYKTLKQFIKIKIKLNSMEANRVEMIR